MGNYKGNILLSKDKDCKTFFESSGTYSWDLISTAKVFMVSTDDII